LDDRLVAALCQRCLGRARDGLAGEYVDTAQARAHPHAHALERVLVLCEVRCPDGKVSFSSAGYVPDRNRRVVGVRASADAAEALARGLAGQRHDGLAEPGGALRRKGGELDHLERQSAVSVEHIHDALVHPGSRAGVRAGGRDEHVSLAVSGSDGAIDPITRGDAAADITQLCDLGAKPGGCTSM